MTEKEQTAVRCVFFTRTRRHNRSLVTTRVTWTSKSRHKSTLVMQIAHCLFGFDISKATRLLTTLPGLCSTFFKSPCLYLILAYLMTLFQTCILYSVVLHVDCKSWMLGRDSAVRIATCYGWTVRGAKEPIPVAERSKTRIYGRSLAGVAGSTPAGCMDICIVCCTVTTKGTSQDNQGKVRVKNDRTKKCWCGVRFFRTRLYRPWGPPSLLYNGYRIIPRGKVVVAWRWPPTPMYRRGERKSRAINLLPLWTFLVCCRVSFTFYFTFASDELLQSWEEVVTMCFTSSSSLDYTSMNGSPKDYTSQHLHALTENYCVHLIKGSLLISRTMSYLTISRTRNFTFFHPSAVLIQGKGRTRQLLLFSERQLLRGFKHYTRYLNKMVAAGNVVGRATSLRIGRTGLRIPVGDFLIPKSIQNGPGAQPASTAMDIGVLSRG